VEHHIKMFLKKILEVLLNPRRIKFLGHIDDANLIKELHANAYAYIHGHEFGGTNPALLKGLAYGNAILALNTVFNQEVLNNGEYGILYKKDVEDLTQKINYLESDENIAESMRKISRRRITENYTWKKITNQYIELFEKMLTSK